MREEEDVFVTSIHPPIHPHIVTLLRIEKGREGKGKIGTGPQAPSGPNSSVREDSRYGQIYQSRCFSRPVQASSEEA